MLLNKPRVSATDCIRTAPRMRCITTGNRRLHVASLRRRHCDRNEKCASKMQSAENGGHASAQTSSGCLMGLCGLAVWKSGNINTHCSSRAWQNHCTHVIGLPAVTSSQGSKRSPLSTDHPTGDAHYGAWTLSADSCRQAVHVTGPNPKSPTTRIVWTDHGR